MMNQVRWARPVKDPNWKKKKRKKKFINCSLTLSKLFLIVSTLGGLVTQVGIVVSEYLERKTVTIVLYGWNKETLPPAITICHPVEDLLPEDVDFKTAGESVINKKMIKLRDLVSSNHTFHHKKIFQNMRDRQCLRLQFDEQKIERGKMISFKLNYQPLVKKNLISYFVVFIHPRGIYPYDGNSIPMYYAYHPINGSLNSFDFSFEHITGHFLEAPFPANCRNYKEEDVSGRGECVGLCSKMILTPKFGFDPCFKDQVFWKFVRLSNKTAVPDKFCESIAAKCERECPVDCHTNIEFPVLNDKYYNPENVAQFDVYRTRPHITITSEPMQSFAGLLFYVVSLIGVWTGLSFFTFGAQILSLCKFMKWYFESYKDENDDEEYPGSSDNVRAIEKQQIQMKKEIDRVSSGLFQLACCHNSLKDKVETFPINN